MYSMHEAFGGELKIGAWHAFVGLGPYMVERARQATATADSYRGFNVGAAALALTNKGDIGIFTAANFKPYAEGPKQCAESSVLRELREHGFSKVVGLFVTGPPQVDSSSGLDLPTLHPCGDCRDMLASDSLIADDTLITTVHPRHDWFEMYTRDELFAVHQSDDGNEEPSVFNTHYDHGFATWKQGFHDFSRWLTLPLPDDARAVQQEHEAARLAATGQLAA